MNILYESWKKESGMKVPASVSIESTIRCNMRCPMCDRTHKEDYQKHLKGEIPVEVLLKNVKILGRMGVKQILLIGGGEPLCRKDLPEVMTCIKKCGMRCHLWTNGTLFTEANAKDIVQNADIITISLDSTIEAEHDKSRGVKGSYAHIMNTIELINKYRLPGLLLRFHSVISKINISSLEKFVDFALDKGAGELGGALVNPWEFAPKDMLFSEDDMLLVNRTLTSLRLLAKEKGIALAGAYCAIFDKGLKEYQEIYDLVDKVEQPTSCFGLWSMATIRPNGDVSVCCFTYKPKMGNLMEANFDEIWNSPKAKKMRGIVKNGGYLDKSCQGCVFGHGILKDMMCKCDNAGDLLDDLVLKSR